MKVTPNFLLSILFCLSCITTKSSGENSYFMSVYGLVSIDWNHKLFEYSSNFGGTTAGTFELENDTIRYTPLINIESDSNQFKITDILNMLESNDSIQRFGDFDPPEDYIIVDGQLLNVSPIPPDLCNGTFKNAEFLVQRYWGREIKFNKCKWAIPVKLRRMFIGMGIQEDWFFNTRPVSEVFYPQFIPTNFFYSNCTSDNSCKKLIILYLHHEVIQINYPEIGMSMMGHYYPGLDSIDTGDTITVKPALWYGSKDGKLTWFQCDTTSVNHKSTFPEMKFIFNIETLDEISEYDLPLPDKKVKTSGNITYRLVNTERKNKISTHWSEWLYKDDE